ncbi:MAG TPA: DUF3068 domain-containing protein [Thermoplasmatales archaeon]|nr:DUF3068 domain-containing protein [Thermoplasmatales archaeon]
MKKKYLLGAIAIALFILSPSIAFYYVPSMKRLPADLNETIYYEGRLGMLNQKTLEFEYRDIEIVRYIKALREEKNVLIVREDIEARDKYTGEEIEELKMTKIYGVNPYTAKNVEGYGDLNRIGGWIFPVGIEKKDYLIWNSDLDDACKNGYISTDEGAAIGHYIGEEKVADVKTYKFYGWQENVFTGYFSELPEAKTYYNGEILAWVEPHTGTIVDLQKHVSQYIVFPDLHKLPSNLNMSVYLKGKAKMLNTENGRYNSFNLTVCNHVEVENTTSNYYLVKNDVTAVDEKGNRIEELCSSSLDAVNPYTMEYLEMLSDKEGLMSFPVGVEKKDYFLWNSDINAPSYAKYCGEGNIAGLKVYKYETNLKDYYIGYQSIEGFSDRVAELYYSGNTTYFVEPSSGSIVYIEKIGKVTAVFPDLHSIPENFAGEVDMEGELSIIGQTKKDIEMKRFLNVENVYWEGNEKILLIKDETVTYDKATGEKIDLACSEEYHGIYADTAEEARNYGDMEREGIYTFPLGTQKRDYIMWNPEINVPSPAEFIREEDHNGIHTYLFQTKEDRIVKDNTLGFEMTVRYVTTTNYWVEPNTGLVIDMEKESVKKINPLEMLTGLRGVFWIDVYNLKLSFTPEMKNKMADEARQMMELVKLSNSEVTALNISLKTEDLISSIEDSKMQKKQIEKFSGKRVKAVDLTYWMSDKSVIEMAETAKKLSFLLIFMQIIIPVFLILVGVVMVGIVVKR